MPVLQASAYRTKKPSRSSGFTNVLNAVFLVSVLSVPCNFELLLFDARIRIGSGFSGCVSHNGSSETFVGDGGVDAASKVTRFCVR
jgi:hypothetical protein